MILNLILGGAALCLIVVDALLNAENRRLRSKLHELRGSMLATEQHCERIAAERDSLKQQNADAVREAVRCLAKLTSAERMVRAISITCNHGGYAIPSYLMHQINELEQLFKN